MLQIIEIHLLQVQIASANYKFSINFIVSSSLRATATSISGALGELPSMQILAVQPISGTPPKPPLPGAIHDNSHPSPPRSLSPSQQSLTQEKEKQLSTTKNSGTKPTQYNAITPPAHNLSNTLQKNSETHANPTLQSASTTSLPTSQSHSPSHPPFTPSPSSSPATPSSPSPVLSPSSLSHPSTSYSMQFEGEWNDQIPTHQFTELISGLLWLRVSVCTLICVVCTCAGSFEGK
jgi:hypothetical protein